MRAIMTWPKRQTLGMKTTKLSMSRRAAEQLGAEHRYRLRV